LRARVPNICFQMLFRGDNAVGYTHYPANVVAGFVRHAAESGIDIFRVFDSLNYLPNLRVAMESGPGDPCDLRSRDLLRRRYSRSAPPQILDSNTYLRLAREMERMGAHFLAIKDMAGLCRPFAAHQLVKALKEEIGLPIHFHTHDTSGISAASVLQAAAAGADVVDLALASMSGSTSQPNLNSVVAALQHTRRDPQLDLGALNEFSDYWEQSARLLRAVRHRPRRPARPKSISTKCPAASTTNLREQASRDGHGPPLAGDRPDLRRGETSFSATSSR